MVQVSVPRANLQAAKAGITDRNHRGPKYSLNVPLIQVNINHTRLEVSGGQLYNIEWYEICLEASGELTL